MVISMVEAHSCSACSIQDFLCRYAYYCCLTEIYLHSGAIVTFWMRMAGVSLFAALGFLLYGGR